MRKPLVAGNWKMNGTRETVSALLDGLQTGLSGEKELGNKVDIAVFPPAIFAQQVADALTSTAVSWGLQNICTEEKGAFTGETSVVMAQEFSCTMVLAGHSERRSLYGETDADVAAKVDRAGQAGLIPVLCVGESLEEREANQTMEVVSRQVKAVLEQASPASLEKLVIAYEPVWAIGTGLTATPEQAQEVHASIRELLAKHDADMAARTRILYGGSVKGSNAAEIFAGPDVDGGLVGGASLNVQDFLSICRAAD
ncbi:triose-phosphate isomerase [Sansalvadorimonas verongulae]|uniref:triose-phosphate isomerase n=1 Tax=Sansalvadorimonas verongulae TaxID=2172824 RepID=UPI0012BCF0A1|nr:triose-phosphate isomerase [Sansalvadorimonas verongulae]MTI15093.1 triose-phosphate isomerase [Sansalvadorimonas verongulae]